MATTDKYDRQVRSTKACARRLGPMGVGGGEFRFHYYYHPWLFSYGCGEPKDNER